MSYSFTSQAANKSEAKAAVAAEVEKIVQQQPNHAKDKEAILANANAAVDLLGDDETRDISVSCNGYIEWHSRDAEDNPVLSRVAINASAVFVNREVAEEE